MSAFPEYRYVCDRCKTSTNVVMASAPPAHTRAAGPEHWTMLSVGSDPGTPAQHLCPRCTIAFFGFMSGTQAAMGAMPAPDPEQEANR